MHFAEVRGTGFPTIYKAMKNNNSPKPVFDTDKQSTYFLTVLPAYISERADVEDKALVITTLKDVVEFYNIESDQVSDQVGTVVNTTVHSRVSDILNLF